MLAANPDPYVAQPLKPPSSAAQAGAPPAQAAQPPNQGLYGQYQAQALDAYNKAKIAIQQKRSGIYQSYGFNPDGSVDGNNSVGGYQQMKHNQALELQGAQNQALERHLGAHGLGAQVANAPRFQEDADSANFAQNYLGALDDNSTQLSGAGSDYQTALINARQAQIEDDIANGRYDTAVDPGSTQSSAVSANAKKTAARLAAAAKPKKAAPELVSEHGRSRPTPKSTPYRGRN
jgi:hypothetical protein